MNYFDKMEVKITDMCDNVNYKMKEFESKLNDMQYIMNKSSTIVNSE